MKNLYSLNISSTYTIKQNQTLTTSNSKYIEQAQKILILSQLLYYNIIILKISIIV